MWSTGGGSLLVTQAGMLAAAAALGLLALGGLVTPWVLLALVFALGTGQALTSPTWQALQPELVAPAEQARAISLGAVNVNLALAIGPAIGGLLLTATSAGTFFLVNAASFLAVIAVIWWWKGARPAGTLPREHAGQAIRAGGRYVAASPALRAILVRAGLFALWPVPRLHPAETSPDSGHQLIEYPQPAARLCAVGSGHQKIIASRHKPE
jgi:MFS family permease